MRVLEAIGTVSVVIPAYNAAATLPGAVDSIGTSPDVLEVLVIDDGSTDETAAVAADSANVSCLHQANSGPSVARNTGIAAARGRWIAFLDADDRWLPGKLEAQLRVARQRPDAVIVAGDWVRDDSGLGPCPPVTGELPVAVHDYADVLVLNRFQTSTVLARTDVLRSLGGFRPELDGAEDWDMWLRCATVGPLVRIRAPVVRYRDQAGGYSKDLRRLYRTMLVMLDREQAAARLSRHSLATILAWHHLRFAVAFELAGQRSDAAAALRNLHAAGLTSYVPGAVLRYLGPFLLSRLARRRRFARTKVFPLTSTIT